MSLQHLLLGLLNQKPRSGYDLNKGMKKYARHFWETDQSRIYRTLNELRRDRLVAYETVVQERTPNKKLYSITEAGRQELHRWLSEPGKMMEEKQRSPFLVQLHFSDQIPIEQQRSIVRERLKMLDDELRPLEAQAEAIGLPLPLPANFLELGLPRAELTLAYGILRYRFEIDYAEQLLALLVEK